MRYQVFVIMTKHRLTLWLNGTLIQITSLRHRRKSTSICNCLSSLKFSKSTLKIIVFYYEKIFLQRYFKNLPIKRRKLEIAATFMIDPINWNGLMNIDEKFLSFIWENEYLTFAQSSVSLFVKDGIKKTLITKENKWLFT